MSLKLSRFSILGLHGKLDIDIPIRDNRLVLIGVNGLGKTTVVNFLYFVLTEQWLRLLDFEFDSVEVVINERLISISKSDVGDKSEINGSPTEVVVAICKQVTVSGQICSVAFRAPVVCWSDSASFIAIPGENREADRAGLTNAVVLLAKDA